MKQLITFAFMSIFLVSLVSAVNVGSGVGIDIKTEDFIPEIWLCDSRVMHDDATEPGRISLDGEVLYERTQNYAFEGEQLLWKVLVMDKNGIEKIEDVFVAIGPHRDSRRMVSYTYNDPSCMSACASIHSTCVSECNQFGTNQTCVDGCDSFLTTCESSCERTGQRLEKNDIEANCGLSQIISDRTQIPTSCNARILEEELDRFEDNVAAFYDCTFTVETPLSMYGEYFVTLEVEDLDGMYNFADEVEYWFFNPVVALGIDGSIAFGNARPGTQLYSTSMLVSNEADEGSGVILDMFISGTDFYDSSSSGAKCPLSNVLKLSNLRYWAANGYATNVDPRADAEGYVPIGYGIGFNDPIPFYDSHEIIQAAPVGGYYAGNVLTPGSDIALTFRLSVPEPCNGDFDTGSVFFWGEAI